MKTSVVILVVLLLTAQGTFAEGQSEKKDDAMMKGPAMEKGPSMQKTDGMQPADPAGFYSTQRMQPRVMPFTTAEAAQGLAAQGPVVYFFAATWCPSCQAAYEDLGRNFRRLPEGVTLVLVNYDTAQALKGRYGIVTQHTFVQINAQGDKVTAWVGSPTVADIAKRVVM